MHEFKEDKIITESEIREKLEEPNLPPIARRICEDALRILKEHDGVPPVLKALVEEHYTA